MKKNNEDKMKKPLILMKNNYYLFDSNISLIMSIPAFKKALYTINYTLIVLKLNSNRESKLFHLWKCRP